MIAARHRHVAVPKNHQDGFALVVALILLLAITIIGVTTIRTTLIERKLATATLDRNITFQAAEAALRRAEDIALAHSRTKPQLAQLVPDDSCDVTVQTNCNSGLCILHDPDCPLRSTDPSVTAWGTASGLDLGPLAGDVAPTYLVEFLGSNFYCREPDPTVPNDPNNYCKRYRITARAQPAGDSRSTVILESLYVTE
ncbi:MAG: PilX N-terminal domain-containing pilus assembly protein [Tepidimonas ignava]|uniref:pilus assembly PilX family protein n=1 Tax=Tepidimonas ignava TaxID=114249 RepID=UPI003919D84A